MAGFTSISRRGNCGIRHEKASQAPATPTNWLSTNQFFTPRYVVEFLTDNTLGRSWFEMRKGETKLKEKCRYMVRRSSEIFLGQGESPPEQKQYQEGLSQGDLFERPTLHSAIGRRRSS